MVRPIALCAVLLTILGCRRPPAEPPAARSDDPSQPTSVPLTPATPVETRPDLPPYYAVPVLRHEQEPWLTEELKAQDPAADGWESEVFVSAAEKTLITFGDALVAGGHIPEDVASRDAQATLISDDLLTTRYANGLITVVAWEATNDPAPPRAPLNEALAQFFAREMADDRRVEWEIYAVTLGQDQIATTDVLVIDLARGKGTWTQTNRRWRVTWKWDRAHDNALISGITTLSLWRATCRGKLFTDCTQAVLGKCRAFTTQLSYGPEHWLSRLDRISHIDISGRSGLAIGDVDGDGLEDVYVAQNGGLPNLLLRHNTDGTVTDISAQAGVDFLDYTSGVLIVDIDNDGDSDLLAAMGHRVLVLYNDGNARFVPGAILPAPDETRIYMITAADFDNDGDLDVYGCRYHDTSGGMRIPVPYHDANNGPSNILWRNDGGRTFTDATVESGLDVNNRRFSFAACWEDYDRDGDLDVYVSNDFGRNNLYRNDGGTFVDVAPQAGAEDMAAGMGVTWSDFDLDGDTDLYVSNMYTAAGIRITHQADFRPDGDYDDRSAYQKHARGNTLLANNGDGTLVDVTDRAGVARGHWAWGALFVDFNNDGLEDLYVPSGFISNQREGPDLQGFFWRRVVGASRSDPQGTDPYKNAWAAIASLLHRGASWAGYERNSAYLNCGQGCFVDISALTGLDFRDDGRAVASVDWDGDLDLDLWIMNRTGPQLRFARNNYDDPQSALAIRLLGVQANRAAIGARLELTAETRRLSRTVYAGSGFVAQSSKWLHFGLSGADEAKEVVIFWPGGERQELDNLQGGRRYVVTQGKSTKVQPPRAESIGHLASMPPSTGEQSIPPDQIRAVLLQRLTIPTIELTHGTGSVRPLQTHTTNGLLLVLWSSESRYSRELLTALTAHHSELVDAPLEIVAFCADQGDALQRSRDWFNSLGAPFAAWTAPRKALAKLLVVKRAVLAKRIDKLVLPTTYLIDKTGKLTVLYEGSISIEQLLADVRGMEESHVAPPFPGQWLKPPQRDLVALARFFADTGLMDDARTYIMESRTRDPRP